MWEKWREVPPSRGDAVVPPSARLSSGARSFARPLARACALIRSPRPRARPCGRATPPSARAARHTSVCGAADDARMLIPRQRIKIALRLWMPVLVLRIVVVQPLVTYEPPTPHPAFIFRSVIDKNFLDVGESVVEPSEAGGFLQQANVLNVLNGVFAKLLS